MLALAINDMSEKLTELLYFFLGNDERKQLFRLRPTMMNRQVRVRRRQIATMLRWTIRMLAAKMNCRVLKNLR